MFTECMEGFEDGLLQQIREIPQYPMPTNSTRRRT